MTYSELDIQDYYTLNATWARNDIFNLDDIDGMIPFERMIYVDVVAAQIERENEEIARIRNQK